MEFRLRLTKTAQDKGTVTMVPVGGPTDPGQVEQVVVTVKAGAEAFWGRAVEDGGQFDVTVSRRS
jgi:hypothetical protein